jgi:HEAT repeat protein
MIQLDGGDSLQSLNELELRSLEEQLTVQLTNSDEEVRATSMELLFFLDAETALMFSDSMLEDTVSWNRLKLLEIIKNGEHPQITEILKKLAKDNDEMVRENAQLILNERGISNLQLEDQ